MEEHPCTKLPGNVKVASHKKDGNDRIYCQKLLKNKICSEDNTRCWLAGEEEKTVGAEVTLTEEPEDPFSKGYKF